jgi:hypothetical protein
MSALVSCPKCGVILDVPETLLGQQVRCATCSTVFEANAQEPGLPSGSAAKPPDGLAGPPQEHEEDERRGRGLRYDPDDADDDDFDDDHRDRRRRMRRDLEPHRATTVLLLGVFSLVTPFACGLLGTVMGIVLGISAIVLGNGDLGKMRGGIMDPDGESQTRTGRILGYVGLLVSVLGLLACGVYMAFVLSLTLSKQR